MASQIRRNDDQDDLSTTRLGSALIISGGSAGNQILDAFTSLYDTCTFVLPVSDNGGSSSEIIRVLGGPSLGDIRSRLVRLIPDNPDKAGIKALFEYRLPSDDEDGHRVKGEWLDIVEGSHPLWRDIPADRREAIRAFLVHFEHAILRRAQRRFNFLSGSVGNFWLAGAQLFVRSLQSAIFLFSSVCGISSNHSVVPAINTNSLVTIAAELVDGSLIVGQNEISHPSPSSTHGQQQYFGTTTPTHSHTPVTVGLGGIGGGAFTPSSSNAGWVEEAHARMAASTSAWRTRETSAEVELDYDDSHNVIARSKYDMEVEQDSDADLANSTPVSAQDPDVEERPESAAAGTRSAKVAANNIIFSKSEDDWISLPSRIARIFYLNTYGQETFPAPSSAFINALNKAEVLVYSCGSLYTSLIPPLALTGVGSAIALSARIRSKVLLLNGTHDRETEGMTAVDFILSITDHLNSTIHARAAAPAGPSDRHLSSHSKPRYSARTPHQFLPSDFVTHLIYPSQGSIAVDEERLKAISIKCISIPEVDRFSEETLKAALGKVT